VHKQLVFRFILALAVINFTVTASLGIVLRLHPLLLFEAFNFRYWTHAHSHVAFLGWVFLALMAFIYQWFLPDSPKVNRKMIMAAAYFQVTILGMLFTFPFTGYALWSIICSSLHMAGSFWLIWYVLKNSTGKRTMCFSYLSAALWFMGLSAAGPLALGPIIAMDMKSTMWYDLAIYFYLHFQYNGWFLLAVFALMLAGYETSGLLKYQVQLRKSFTLMVAGVILTFVLSVLPFKPGIIFYWIGGLGAVLQIMGVTYLKPFFYTRVNGRFRWLLVVFIFALLTKLMLQLLSAFPEMSPLAFHNKDVVIAYLHLVLLGVISAYLVDLISVHFSVSSTLENFVVCVYVGGFILTEAFILMSGFQLLNVLWTYVALVAGGIMMLMTGFGLFYKTVKASHQSWVPKSL